MPVDDAPVSEKLKISTGHRARCFNNRGMKPGYLAKDGLITETRRVNGEVVNVAGYRMKYIEHVMTTVCRQVGAKVNGEWRELPECEGCTADKETEWIAAQRKKIDADT